MNKFDLINYKEKRKYWEDRILILSERKSKLQRPPEIQYNERVQNSSKVNDTFAEELSKVIDQETEEVKEINQKIAALEKSIYDILEQIESPTYKRLLQLRYIDMSCNSTRDVMQRYKKVTDEKYMNTLINKAVNLFDRICRENTPAPPVSPL